MIHSYYHVSRSSLPPQPEILLMELAKLIEVTLGLRRALAAVPIIRCCLDGLKAGQITRDELSEAFERIRFLMEYLPNYHERQEETKLLIA